MLPQLGRRQVKLLITSPPYHDVTDYWNDHWLRLWILGQPMRKDWGRTQKHANLKKYRALMFDVCRHAKRHLRGDGVVLVRCGTKKLTAETCEQAIRAAWPSRTIIVRRTQVTRRGRRQRLWARSEDRRRDRHRRRAAGHRGHRPCLGAWCWIGRKGALVTQRLAESTLPLRENSLDSVYEKNARHRRWSPVNLFMDRTSAVQPTTISMENIDPLPSFMEIA